MYTATCWTSSSSSPSASASLSSWHSLPGGGPRRAGVVPLIIIVVAAAWAPSPAPAPKNQNQDGLSCSSALKRRPCGGLPIAFPYLLEREGRAKRPRRLDLAVAPGDRARAGAPAAHGCAILGADDRARKHRRARARARSLVEVRVCGWLLGRRVEVPVVGVRGRGERRGRRAARAVVGARHGLRDAIGGGGRGRRGRRRRRAVRLSLRGHGCAFAVVPVVPAHVGVDAEAAGAARERALEGWGRRDAQRTERDGVTGR